MKDVNKIGIQNVGLLFSYSSTSLRYIYIIPVQLQRSI